VDCDWKSHYIGWAPSAPDVAGELRLLRQTAISATTSTIATDNHKEW